MSLFHQLYERYARDVHRFAFYLCGDRALADDVTSETFVRAWSSETAIRVETAQAYLFAIARNLVNAERRRGKRLTTLDEVSANPGSGPDADSSMRLAETLRALATLNEADRAALLMRAEHGMDYATIAAAFGISEGTAKVRVHRARATLARRMGMKR